MRLILTLLASLWAAAAPAQSTGLVTLQTGDDSRGWEAVGRLDIAGKGFCTAALISEDTILTAAHCVYDHDNSLITADRFTFEAGLRNGRAEATRAVSHFVAHPDYVPDGPTSDVAGVALDIAVLRLDRPLRHTRITPFAIAPSPARGDTVGIVSYGAGREEAPSLEAGCEVLDRQRGAFVMSCEVAHGSSGAPVFTLAGGVPRIVSVVAAIAYAQGDEVALGTQLQDPLNEILVLLETPPAPTTNRITVGTRTTSGAKFVRP